MNEKGNDDFSFLGPIPENDIYGIYGDYVAGAHSYWNSIKESIV